MTAANLCKYQVPHCFSKLKEAKLLKFGQNALVVEQYSPYLQYC